jgi:hypothetical protein
MAVKPSPQRKGPKDDSTERCSHVNRDQGRELHVKIFDLNDFHRVTFSIQPLKD